MKYRIRNIKHGSYLTRVTFVKRAWFVGDDPGCEALCEWGTKKQAMDFSTEGNAQAVILAVGPNMTQNLEGLEVD